MVGKVKMEEWAGKGEERRGGGGEMCVCVCMEGGGREVSGEVEREKARVWREDR